VAKKDKKLSGGSYFCFSCIFCKKQFHLYIPDSGIIVFPPELVLNGAHRLVHQEDDSEVVKF